MSSLPEILPSTGPHGRDNRDTADTVPAKVVTSLAPIWSHCLICRTVDPGDGRRPHLNALAADLAALQLVRVSDGVCDNAICRGEYRRRFCGRPA